MSSSFGPVASYLPHRPPMLLIDHIDEITPRHAVCRTTIQPDCVFARDGFVHPSAMIEFVAQVCAIAATGTTTQSGEPPRLGVIVSCREVSFTIDRFAIGDELTIAVSKVLGEEELAVFNGTVSRGGEVCVTIQLSAADAKLAGLQPSAPGSQP
jgi:predicted hotdog family 3-hydroxylacyl-ACP dehydratase